MATSEGFAMRRCEDGGVAVLARDGLRFLDSARRLERTLKFVQTHLWTALFRAADDIWRTTSSPTAAARRDSKANSSANGYMGMSCRSTPTSHRCVGQDLRDTFLGGVDRIRLVCVGVLDLLDSYLAGARSSGEKRSHLNAPAGGATSCPSEFVVAAGALKS